MNRGLIIKITIIVLIVLGLIFFIFLGRDNSKILKPEYGINETASIDNIELKLTNVKYINKASGIEVSFDITNKTDNTITIIPEDYFKFYDVNKVQIPNKYKNDKNIIKKDETLVYKLQYDVTKKELYEIYFYSQIAENNVKFSFKSKDIELDEVTESGSDKKEEKTIDE